MNSYYTLTSKQKEILEVATDLFYQNGFKETSMRDLGNAMNLKAASLYAHLTTKEEILEWAISHFVDLCENEYDNFFHLKGGSVEKIAFMIEKNIKIVRENMKYSELMKRYFDIVSPTTQQRYYKFLQDYTAMLAEILSEFMTEKYLKFDPLLTAKFFIHNMNYHYKWIPESWTDDEIIKFFKEKMFFCNTGAEIEI